MDWTSQGQTLQKERRKGVRQQEPEGVGSAQAPIAEVGMKSGPHSDRLLELVAGTATVLLMILAYLIASPALGALSLVSGGVSYGILLTRRRDRE